MKKIKQIITAFLTFILSFNMINTVLAEGAGSIIINGTTANKTYEIYKIFDLTYSGTKVAYTIDEDWTSFFDENGAGSKYIIATNTDNLNQITIGNITKYINITDDNIAEFTKTALIYATTLTTNDGSITAEEGSDSVTFTNLDLGYYLIYPQGATDIKEGNSTICSITSTIPTAEVYIKANYPTIDKTVDDQNAEVGQLVEFTITGLVPDTTGYDTYTYEIKDTMSAGLELDSQTASLTVTFDTTIIEVDPIYTTNGFTLTFDMTKYQEYVGKNITITYKAKVTEAAVNSTTTKNSATLTYSNNPKDLTSKTTTPPVEIPVYSSEINVIKVDATDETIKLAGASFVLQNDQGLYYQALNNDGTIISKLTTTTGIAKVNWVETQEAATLLITDTIGIVTFKGIENGTYYLLEVEAPSGYNKLSEPVTIKVGYKDESGTNLGTVAVSHKEIVQNNSGTTLPITGGIGTTIFIIAGSLLTIVSAVLLITNKRITKEY